MTVNLPTCEENHKLHIKIVDAWEHYNRLKGVLPTTGEDEVKRKAALAEAGDKANRLSAEQDKHVKTCPICKPHGTR
jgi:hypothetical protein